MPFMSMEAREYQIYGPQGGIAFKVTLPEDFNTETDRCPMVILMHGIFSSKDYNPMVSPPSGSISTVTGKAREGCRT